MAEGTSSERGMEQSHQAPGKVDCTGLDRGHRSQQCCCYGRGKTENNPGMFNPNKTGGYHGPPPPSTFCTITLQRAKLSPQHLMTIFFRVSHTF